MIRVIEAEKINEFELIVVLDRLKEQGKEWATIQPGNRCIWVSSGSSSCPLNQYFIFREGKLVDVQVD
jgi:hypothetical protein